MPEYSNTTITPADGVQLPAQNGGISGNFALSALRSFILASKGQANGLAGLGPDGKLDPSQVPDSLDDVLVYATRSNFPATGTAGKIYIAADTNRPYRWDDALATPDYVELSVDLSDYATKAELAAEESAREAEDTNLKNAFTSSFADGLLVGESVSGKIMAISSNKAQEQTFSGSYTKVACSEGDVFATNGSDNANMKAWLFVDSQGNVLSKSITTNYAGGGVATLRRTDIAIAPNNATMLYVNYSSTTPRKLYKGTAFDNSTLRYQANYFWTIYTVGEVSIVQRNNGACLRGFLSPDVAIIIAKHGFEFSVMFVNDDGSPVGVIDVDNTLNNTTSYVSAWFNICNIREYSSARVLINVKKTNQASITDIEAQNAITFYDSNEVQLIDILPQTFPHIAWRLGYINIAGEPPTFEYVEVNGRISSSIFERGTIKTIVAKKGYLFRVGVFDDNMNPIGILRTNGSFSPSGSSKNMKQYDISELPYKYYVLTVINDDLQYGDIATSEGNEALYFLDYSLGNEEEDTAPFPSTNVNKNICLAGIRKNMPNNKIPTCTGFLFHRFDISGDNSLWYGTDFETIKKIGGVSFNVNDMRFAISPKDGRIIATKRDTRDGIYIWDGTTETHLTNFASKPCGWLYNSGVDFCYDPNTGDEYCIFAEYWGNTVITPLYVWRGKYPYTSESDWEIVLTQNAFSPGVVGDGITHFHMIRRDPWTGYLYCTSGDDSEKCKWWYSTDLGATWTLLTTGETSGYELHTCRCINFIFTKDYIYWATDKGTNHSLNRVSRDVDGILDPSTRTKLADLADGHATNFICYSQFPHGIFMYDRVDVGYTSDYGTPVIMNFWNLDTNTLETPFSIPLSVQDWGGSRGKCYVDYTSGYQPYPAMGFSADTPCIFDIIALNLNQIGTIKYDIGSKTIGIPTTE